MKGKELRDRNFAIGVISVGFIVTMVGAIKTNLSLTALGVTVAALGLGLISIAEGRKASRVADESNNRMKAMAALQFDRALSWLADYSEPRESWKDRYYDARGLLHLVPWATEEMKRELKRALTQVRRQAQAQEDQGLVSAIDQLCCQYGVDKLPDGDSVPNTLR